MLHGKSAVGAKWPRIEYTRIPVFTPVMGDGMKGTRWIMPGNGDTSVNVNECRRVVGGERADRNTKGGWARYCYGTYHQQDHA